jgi:hypothetical protein
MAERNFDFMETLGRKKRVISGSFAPNGSSALVAANTKGVGFTVAYVSTGLYRITFTNSYGALQSATASLQLASGDDKYVQFGTYTPATASAAATLDLRVWDASGAGVADVAADANNRIHFKLVMDDALQV